MNFKKIKGIIIKKEKKKKKLIKKININYKYRIINNK